MNCEEKFIISRDFPELLTFFDITKNSLNPNSDSISKDVNIHWSCEKGHQFEGSLASLKYGGCPECNPLYRLLPTLFFDSIACNTETIEDSFKLLYKKVELDKIINSRYLLYSIVYVNYMFDLRILSDEIIQLYLKHGILLQGNNGQITMNIRFRLIDHRLAIKNIQRTFKNEGLKDYSKLDSNTLLWLRLVVHLQRKMILPLEIYKAMSKLSIVVKNLCVANDLLDFLSSRNLLIGDVVKSSTVSSKMKPKEINEKKETTKIDIQWIEKLNHVNDHLSKYGHFKNLSQIEFKWFLTQIKFYFLNNLSSEKTKALVSSGALEKYENLKHVNKRWLDKLNLLKNYINSPSWDGSILSNTIVENIKLGEWVFANKELFLAGQMSPDVKCLFDRIGFDFNSVHKSEETLEPYEPRQLWEYALLKLIEFKDEYGCINVPFNFIVDDHFDLGHWLYYQKKRIKENKMSDVRVSIFKVLGVDNDNTPKFKDGTTFESLNDFQLEVDWYKKFNLLKEYVEAENTVSVPVHLCIKSVGVGLWTKNQLSLAAQNKLPQNRIRKLIEIGLVKTAELEEY